MKKLIETIKRLIEWWKEFDQPPRSDWISVCMLVGLIVLGGALLGLFDKPTVVRKGVPPPPAGHHCLLVRDGWHFPPGWELKDGVWFPTDGGNPVVPDFD